MRRAARVDDNHAEIVAYLRKCGYSVLSLAPMGHGVPDLLVARHGFACLVEVKDGKKSPSERKLTPDEIDFAERWRGPLIVATSCEDAAKQLLALKYARVCKVCGVAG